MTDRVGELNAFGAELFPGLIGLEITRVDESGAEGSFLVTPPLVAGNGFVWAPVVVGLADILCAYAIDPHLPEGAGFTTVELKTNFLGSATLEDEVVGRSWPVHIGRTTHVWDAEVTNATTGRPMAQFRNTQLVLAAR